MNNYAQAPRDDLRLPSCDTLGLPHSIDRGISQRDIQRYDLLRYSVNDHVLNIIND